LPFFGSFISKKEKKKTAKIKLIKYIWHDLMYRHTPAIAKKELLELMLLGLQTYF
jgi:hypothetical protein